MMRAEEARQIAREWVLANEATEPGFIGAYLAGSITELPDDAPLDPASDVDVMVVRAGEAPAVKPGKLRHQGVLLEITHLSLDEVRTPERVLSHYHLAAAFRHPVILADARGHLAMLRKAVGDGFARREWVERRVAMAQETVLARLATIDPTTPWHQQVMAWLFAAGGIPHVLLVAGLRNPTVRKRYVAARELLEERGLGAAFPPLLEVLGCAAMTPAQVARHVDVLSEAFDDAGQVVVSPFPFAADLSAEARPVAIDGSRALIASGDHREAVFWIAATYARCMFVFAADAPDLLPRWEPGFHALVADLGLTEPADLPARADAVRAVVPFAWETAMTLMDDGSSSPGAGRPSLPVT